MTKLEGTDSVLCAKQGKQSTFDNNNQRHSNTSKSETRRRTATTVATKFLE